jgi:hypothetical protein
LADRRPPFERWGVGVAGRDAGLGRNEGCVGPGYVDLSVSRGRVVLGSRLRETAANILARTASDEQFEAAMRVPDLKLHRWSKFWMEEIFPCWRLAAELGFSDDDTFKWTPVGAADVEFRTGGKAVKIQCTTAYAERVGTIAKQGGHLRSLEMKESNATGMVWLGGGLTTPRTVDVDEDREVR